MEIGSSDFNTLLPLCKNGWKGVLVEPIPILAENIQKKIAAEGLQAAVVNMAVSDHDGELQMRKILGHEHLGLVDSQTCSDNFESIWFRGTSHVDLSSTGEKYGIPSNEHLSFEDITVKCIKLNTLIEKLEIDNIDFMQIDVEGHELHILENYDFRIRPMIIKVEHEHMAANGRDLKDIVELLKENKYKTFVEEKDVYGIY